MSAARGRKSMSDMRVGRESSGPEISQRSTARCSANSSNRPDEYINCLVATQRWPLDEITRSPTFSIDARHSIVLSTIQTQQHDSCELFD
jgi:hypothetical protein